MKQVPVKVQRILMFLPYLNILNLFIWLYNSNIIRKAVITLPRTLWILFSTAIPLTAMYFLLGKLGERIGQVILNLNAYFIPFIVSYRLIEYQLKLQVEE